MIRNLAQLKKAMSACPCFEIIQHHIPEHTGERRRVTLANTVGFYSGIDGQPEHTISKANQGRGYYLDWGKATSWSFENGLCSRYQQGREHTPENLVLSFRVREVT